MMTEEPIRYTPASFTDVLAKHQPEIAEPATTLLSKSTGNLDAMAAALGELLTQSVAPNTKDNTLEWVNSKGRNVILQLNGETPAAAKADADKKLADEAAAEQKLADDKAAKEVAAAEKKATDEAAANEKKAAEDEKAAEQKAAEDKKTAEDDKKAADKLAADEKKAAEAAAVTEKKAADEAAATKKAAEQKADDDAAAIKKTAEDRAAKEVAEAISKANDATTAAAKKAAADKDAKEAAEQAESSLEGVPGTFFADLAKLTGDTTLILTIAQTGVQGDDPLLTVTIMPRANTREAEPFIHPISVTATPAELDESFTTLISSAADGNRGIQAAIRDLEAAKEAAAEATKLEAAAKKAKANKKAAKNTPEKPLFGAK